MGGTGSGGNQNSSHDGSKQDGLPSKPKDFNGACSDVWDGLVLQIPEGILRSVDGIQLETLTKLIVQGRALSSMAMANPADVAGNRAWMANADLVRKLSACFGLSPSDRKRLAIPPVEPESEFGEMLKRRMAPREI